MCNIIPGRFYKCEEMIIFCIQIDINSREFRGLNMSGGIIYERYPMDDMPWEEVDIVFVDHNISKEHNMVKNKYRFEKEKVKEFVKSHRGDILHFSDNNLNWVENALLSYSDIKKYGIVFNTIDVNKNTLFDNNIKEFWFCYEYFEYINDLPAGIKKPGMEEKK